MYETLLWHWTNCPVLFLPGQSGGGESLRGSDAVCQSSGGNGRVVYRTRYSVLHGNDAAPGRGLPQTAAIHQSRRPGDGGG